MFHFQISDHEEAPARAQAFGQTLGGRFRPSGVTEAWTSSWRPLCSSSSPNVGAMASTP